MFLLNNHHTIAYTDVQIALSEVGLRGAAAVSVRDIWARKDAGTATATLTLGVPPRDSRFLLLTPVASTGGR